MIGVGWQMIYLFKLTENRIQGHLSRDILKNNWREPIASYKCDTLYENLCIE